MFKIKLDNEQMDTLYNEQQGFGRVNHMIKQRYEYLNINEIGNAFIGKGEECPYYYRIQVPNSGNYKVIIGIEAVEESLFSIFLERRRCYLKNYTLSKGHQVTMSFICNICPIIPEGKIEKYEDLGVDITLIGENFRVFSIEILEVASRTIYMIGDSTSTDQTAAYPYNPFKSYCGWTQMLPLFLDDQIALSNHAHSGRTTESFREEGHWQIIRDQLKAQDWVMIQFGHNDQKRIYLDAFGGYSNCLREYIEEIREVGAYPVLITPVSRSLWNGPKMTFNDLLADYAKACKRIGEEMKVPVIDLHERSKRFICTLGPIESMKYFYPEDWTHFNDFGGEEIARLVVEEIRHLELELVNNLKKRQVECIEIEQLIKWERPTIEQLGKMMQRWELSNEWVKEI